MKLDNKFEILLKNAKKRLLQMHFESNSGHIGGNLSCIDFMLVLHFFFLSSKDKFILSKGHSAGALYVTLWSLGLLKNSDLRTFSKDNTILAGHPSSSKIPGVIFPTGSLGHGPSLAAGISIANKYTNKKSHVYCLCSDGEWQEGSCWEALIFANHNKLNNLTIIIDQNKLQGFGRTRDVISCDDLTTRLSSFGVNVIHANGHDTGEIYRAIEKSKKLFSIIILDTIKGNGLDSQNEIESHYLPISKKQLEKFLSKI